MGKITPQRRWHCLRAVNLYHCGVTGVPVKCCAVCVWSLCFSQSYTKTMLSKSSLQNLAWKPEIGPWPFFIQQCSHIQSIFPCIINFFRSRECALLFEDKVFVVLQCLYVVRVALFHKTLDLGNYTASCHCWLYSSLLLMFHEGYLLAREGSTSRGLPQCPHSLEVSAPDHFIRGNVWHCGCMVISREEMCLPQAISCQQYNAYFEILSLCTFHTNPQPSIEQASQKQLAP